MDARFMQIHNLVVTREVIINSMFPVDRMRELNFPSPPPSRPLPLWNPFGKGWKSMTTLPPFLTQWILVEFAGSSDEDILMIKVRTKREKRPKTWSLRFDLLTIKMCTRDYKPWRLVLRCWCLTSMNHEVMCGGDREIFVTIIEGSLQFDLILLQLWNKITLSSRWPPSFKSLQITSSLLSLCCPIGHKA